MMVIADSGSTSTTWSVVNAGREVMRFQTEGLNPFFVSAAHIRGVIEDAFPAELDASMVRQVHFYGAGCMGSKVDVVAKAMNDVFHNAMRYIYVDLLGASRGLLGHRPGFAAILGTGTNSGLYDGRKIVHHIDSLGFILGDEGSGSAIGSRLLGDFLRGYMPAAVHAAFAEAYELRHDDVLHRVYSEPWPNRYCAGFARFISPRRLEDDYCHGVVRQCFDDFFRNIVSRYPGYRDETLNCVGSVAHAFRAVLREVADAYGMASGRIMASPMEGLIDFHCTKETCGK